MEQINQIRIRPAKFGEKKFFEIWIDNKLLNSFLADKEQVSLQYLSPLGWESHPDFKKKSIASQFLNKGELSLKSGRISVLVCEYCGEIGCGGVAVRITKKGNFIIWNDWKYEDGYGKIVDFKNLDSSANLIFEFSSYQDEINKFL